MDLELLETGSPVCPHCRYQQEEWWNHCNVDETNETKCEQCGKKFWVSRYDSPRFTTGLTEEEVEY